MVDAINNNLEKKELKSMSMSIYTMLKGTGMFSSQRKIPAGSAERQRQRKSNSFMNDTAADG